MPLAHVRCPHCGEQNLPTDLVCLECGAEMVERPEEEAPPEVAYEPPRGPVASGLAYSITLALLFVASAVAISLIMQAAWWARAWCVLAAWWVIWFVALVILLGSGRKVVDDYRDSAPRDVPISDYGGYGYGYGRYGRRADYLVTEMLLMVFTVLGYGVLLAMLSNATDRSRGAQWSRSVAVGWAFLWATAYCVPGAVAIGVALLARV